MNRILEKIQKLSRLSEGKIYYSDIKYISLFAIIVFIAAICILFCVHKFYFKQKENFIHKNRVILFIAGITVLFSVSVYAYYYGEEAKGRIIINEICGDSTYIGYVDGVRYADYVELYNNGALYFRTAALYLSDSELEPQKYFIQNVELAPYEHRLIPVVDDDFKIKKTKSQNILLYDEKGREIDSVTTIPIKDGYSYGREIDGSSVWHSMRQTPGERNDLYTYDVKAPVFSKKSGFYDEDFLLEMHADDGCDIYYTLDGRIPDESSIHYENPINVYDKSDEPNIYRSIQSVMIYWTEYNPDPIKPPVDKAFVVRAVAIDKDGNKSEAVTSTYFVDKSEYKDEFVISLVAAPEDLFGEHGIYVTGAE